MSTLHFHAVPLTPVHIGDGSTLQPEEFLIENGELLRYRPGRVIAEMSIEQQQRFADAVGAGRLKKSQELIRSMVDRAAHVFERIHVGRGSEDYLRNAVANPDRAGDATPFVRMAGHPYVPGSSLKGAFRTALISDRGNAERRSTIEQKIAPELERLRRDLPRAPRTGRIADDLQRLALDYDRGATEGDPLRDVAVADAMLGPGSTRFDKVAVGWTPRKRDDRKKGRQLHVERLLSVIDRIAPADVSFTLSLTITDPERQDRRHVLNGAKTPRSPVRLAPLLEAMHGFHFARWQDEIERLFPAKAPVRRRLEEALKKAEAYAATLSPSAALHGIPPALLRLGRFTGFESKSVETWRRGWAPQAKKLLERAGTHSMVVDDADVLSFGWILLCPADAPVPQRTEAPRPTGVPGAPSTGAPAARQPQPPTPRRRAFVGEDEVKILKRDGDVVTVQFVDDNDTEFVDASEIRYE